MAFSQKIADLVDKSTATSLRQPDMETNLRIMTEINQCPDLYTLFYT